MKIKHHSLFKSLDKERIDWDYLRDDSRELNYYIPNDIDTYEKLCTQSFDYNQFNKIKSLMTKLGSTQIFSLGSGRSCLEYKLAKLKYDVIISDNSKSIKRLKNLNIFTEILNLNFQESIKKIRDKDVVLLGRIDTEIDDDELMVLFNELGKKAKYVIFIPAKILNLKNILVEAYIRFKSSFFFKKKIFCGYIRSTGHLKSLWKKSFDHKNYKTFYLLKSK
tara:strand:- start:274 stop:936 length:663 start_codon:yes stop_codon:yes gene_type:complete